MSRRVDIHAADAYVVAATDTTRRKHEDTSLPAKMVRMKRRWDEHGTIRSVEAVMLVHRHRHPHVLLLEIDGGAAGKTFRLPGGKCPVEADALGDPDTETLLKKLQRKLFSATVGITVPPAAVPAPVPTAAVAGSPAGAGGLGTEDAAAGGAAGAAPPIPTGTTLASGTVLPLRIGELLSTWHRPNYEALMYPYVPPHVTRPKEQRNVYLVHLEPDVTFTVPRHMRVVAVPLFELYDNAAKYGSVIAGVPHMVSRLMLSPT
jgi:cleavage and polyadenylation specificity factor subunit 5